MRRKKDIKNLCGEAQKRFRKKTNKKETILDGQVPRLEVNIKEFENKLLG